MDVLLARVETLFGGLAALFVPKVRFGSEADVIARHRGGPLRAISGLWSESPTAWPKASARRGHEEPGPPSSSTSDVNSAQLAAFQFAHQRRLAVCLIWVLSAR
jgi:hypothetical protein